MGVVELKEIKQKKAGELLRRLYLILSKTGLDNGEYFKVWNNIGSVYFELVDYDNAGKAGMKLTCNEIRWEMSDPDYAAHRHTAYFTSTSVASARTVPVESFADISNCPQQPRKPLMI